MYDEEGDGDDGDDRGVKLQAHSSCRVRIEPSGKRAERHAKLEPQHVGQPCRGGVTTRSELTSSTVLRTQESLIYPGRERTPSSTTGGEHPGLPKVSSTDYTR